MQMTPAFVSFKRERYLGLAKKEASSEQAESSASTPVMMIFGIADQGRLRELCELRKSVLHIIFWFPVFVQQAVSSALATAACFLASSAKVLSISPMTRVVTSRPGV